MHTTLRRLGWCFLLMELVLVTPVRGQIPDTVAVQTDHLTLAYVAESGVLTLRVRDAQEQEVYQTESPALYLDGVRQRGFQVVEQMPCLVLENAAVRVSFDVLGPRAIAVTWAARDDAVHDFDLRLRSDDQTAYYGTDERFNALNQRGYALPLATDDRYGNKGVGSHKPVPFFMSTHGYGVWVDSFAPGHFDLDATERFATKLRFPETALRVVFMAGPRLADILETYTGLTGRSPVPPPWAFGLWKSRDVHHNQDSVLVDIEKLRRYEIPASVLVIDSPWETGYNNFEVNTHQFPEPEQMFAQIEERGFALCLWMTPFVNSRNVIDMQGITPASSNYEDAVAHGYLVTDSSGAVAQSDWWKGRGGLVDFTNPEAAAWWHEQLAKTKVYGARAFKVDDGEGNFVPDAVFHDGTPAYTMTNRYAVVYDSVMQAYVDQHLGDDGVLITRSGYTGTQRYPFAWAGDNRGDFSFADGLPSVILAGQNAALSGFSLWGSDIAGYAGTPTKEVFLRWTQFGAFSPFMQVHMTANLGPWDFDAETLEIFQAFARLRAQLFPYLYEAAHETARTGLPIIRPMVLGFPDDPAAHRHIYQYLFGPDLLVAPVYQPGTHRAVYLPEGTWYDFWTGTAYDGGRTIEVHAPLDTMPLFVRAGALLPMLPEDVQTLVPRHDRMADDVVALDDRRVLQVWPGGSGTVTTWEGLSATLAQDGNGVRLDVSSEHARPLEVQIVYRDVANLDAGEATVQHDASRRMMMVSFASLEGTRTVTWEE